MPKLEELLRLVNEASSRTARIQALAAKMDTHTLDDYDANLLSAHLEIVIDNLRTVQEMASYLSRPIKETSRLWKNGSGQYETTAGFCFREGSPIEVLFRELDKDGIGLIERKKQGQGRPTRIYVKNFILPPEPGQPQHPEQTPPPCGSQTAENQRSRPLDSAALLTAEIPQSAPLEMRGLDSGFSAPNKTEKKKTELNDTDPSILPPTPAPFARARPKSRMRMDEMDRYRELIKENIDYDLLLTEHPYDEETLEGYVELMVEVCCSRRDFIRIAGEEVATGVVKSRFLKLGHEHIAYVLESLSQNTTLVKNIKAYTLAALYNAPTTIGQYYASLVSHDLAQDAAGI